MTIFHVLHYDFLFTNILVFWTCSLEIFTDYATSALRVSFRTTTRMCLIYRVFRCPYSNLDMSKYSIAFL